MDSSRFHILCQDEFLEFEQNDENGENFLGKREKEKLGVRREELGVEGGYWKCEMEDETTGRAWSPDHAETLGYLKIWNL
jgi:hypothetical protein